MDTLPQNGEQYERDPQKAHPWAETRRMTYRSSKSDHVCGLGVSGRIKLKNVYLRNHNMCFFHVFAQTTHVVAAPHEFACVGILATRLYIPSFFEILSGVSEPPRGGQNLAFPITLASRFYNSLYYRTSRDFLHAYSMWKRGRDKEYHYFAESVQHRHR